MYFSMKASADGMSDGSLERSLARGRPYNSLNGVVPKPSMGFVNKKYSASGRYYSNHPLTVAASVYNTG